MKLMVCSSCHDIVSLSYGGMRSCLCGESWGDYVDPDETDIVGHAVVAGPAHVLGLANTDLNQLPEMYTNPYRVDMLRCWAITYTAYDANELTRQLIDK